jgi:YbbR domain-containing protein
VASRIREILFGNLGLKIASLVLALLLYAHVLTEQQRESVVQVPLTLIGLPESLTVTGHPPERVGVKIRGRWKDLIRLGLTASYLPIDLAHATPGVYRSTITTDEVVQKALPPELSKAVVVTEVLEPRTVQLAIEPKKVKRVPIVPSLQGVPAAGYRLAKATTVVPESVEVRGPRSAVDALDSLRTLPIDIAGEREKIQRQVDVDPGASGLAVEPRRCLVIVHFERNDSEEPTGRP